MSERRARPLHADGHGHGAATQAILKPTTNGKKEKLLKVEDLRVFYGAARALDGISFHVAQGEVVTIIGPNGAGKSTTLKTVSGVGELLKSVSGSITFAGERVEKKSSHHIARMGMAHVPEGRRVFAGSTVEDNLLLGAYRRRRMRAAVNEDLERVYERFPVLRERRSQPAGYLSGGEQQMLAIGRGLMASPQFLLLDEPSLGLAPLLVSQVFDIIAGLAADGTTILLVEQLAHQALRVADRAYVLEAGVISGGGDAAAMAADPHVREAYLGA
ncbi:MAG TPA: ABC transporter ATP-binding protein [Acidimicrobiales bacterium]|nr:ABC transporter ATP-binding protein [Acidimicrobiales bacterium]